MKLSKTGKPLCCRCRRLATNSLEYGVTENGARKKQFIYHCNEHATEADVQGIVTTSEQQETTATRVPDPDELLVSVRASLKKEFYTADIVEGADCWSFTTLAETPIQALANIRTFPYCERINCLHEGFGHETPDLLKLTPAIYTNKITGKREPIYRGLTSDGRVLCTLEIAIEANRDIEECDLFSPDYWAMASIDGGNCWMMAICEACGDEFRPTDGYYENELEPTYSYCADCCHW